MPAVPDWSAAMTLTNPYSGTLLLNQLAADGYLYLLDESGCQFNVTVRSTKDDVPQSDGSILHHRFMTGTEMTLAIQLWQNRTQKACDAILSSMVDNLTGSLRSLLNAGDNQGRLSWAVDGKNERFLDDCRLLVYPSYAELPVPTVIVTIDSEYPYAQETEATPDSCADGDTVTLTNTGTAAYWPVFRPGPATAFTITVVNSYGITTQFVYVGAGNPGGVAIGGGDCAEINCFRNTIFLAVGCGSGDDANLKAGVDELNSDYPFLTPGDNDVSITGASMDILWAPAYG